jgi:hypothetical protein
MSLNYYNPKDRYRQRHLQRMSGFLVVFGVMLCAGIVGYYFGKERANQDAIFLRKQVAGYTDERNAMQDMITELRTEARTATMRFEELEKTYKTAVPEGPTGDLLALVNKQLAEGMDPQRLAFLIRSARPPRNCTDPETQRFIVSTPLYTGTESKANIAQGGIYIKASGLSAKNEKGDKEAWYDASKAVNLEFITKDGRTEKKAGVMPLSHSIVLGGREYRFTVSEGARSFAKVTFDSCDYP